MPSVRGIPVATVVVAVAAGGCGGDDSRSSTLSAPPSQPPSADIAFSSGGHIHAMRPDGSGRRRLTRGPADAQPAWSPDATRLAFARQVGAGERSRGRIYLIDPDGGRPRPLGVPDDVSSPAWSPDGSRIAFVRWSPDEVAIAVADVDGGGEEVLVRDSSRPEDRVNLGEPAWSPDGARIVYTRTTLDREYTFRPSLYTVAADGGDSRLLARAAADAAWAPDGRRIAFAGVRDRNDKDCWDQCHLRAELYVMDSDGGNARRLTRNRGSDRSPSWSPDGRRIAFASDRNYPGRAGPTEIYSIRPDGSCLTWLTNGVPSSGDPAWRNAPATSSHPGRCGATRRRPRLEADIRALRGPGRPPAYWLGRRHGNLLLSTTDGSRDRRSLREYFLHYADCARFEPRACPPPLQLQEMSVCSRRGSSTLGTVNEPEYGHRVRALAQDGLLLVDIGQGDLSVIAGATSVRIFPGVGGARGRRQMLRAARVLRRFGAPRQARPAPALPRTLLRGLDRTERVHRRTGSIAATARSLGIPPTQVRRRLQLAGTVRALPRVRAIACPR